MSDRAVSVQEQDTLQALLVTPAWFVVLGVAWAIIRRRTDHVARYQAFEEELAAHAKIKNG